jgi:6,7-dimethyl-8-ribityllumazine synthase
MLRSKKPVIFGVLTTNDEAQAHARIGGKHGHKGRDCAEVAVEMLNLAEMIL